MIQILQKQIKELPDTPGIYLFKNNSGEVVYVGKATSLQDRVRSYFLNTTKQWNRPIEQMIGEVVSVGYQATPTVIEAVILEANTIKQLRPKYNVLLRDDKSFSYLAVTRDIYPQLKIIRGHEAVIDWFVEKSKTPKEFRILFGPYTSAHIIETALKILRNIFPYSTCKPGSKRACLYYEMGKCPGVCIGAVTPKEYLHILRPIILFFEGKKNQILKESQQRMKRLSRLHAFEEAAKVRNQLFALEHIQDIALIQREQAGHTSLNPIFGRVEGYDISNISGTSAVGSMVVFVGGIPKKSEYRKFRIKTVKGSNDVAMLREVLSRRLKRMANGWLIPGIFLIDGGKPQVNAAKKVIRGLGVHTPIIGIAKGSTRKKTDIYQIGGGIALTAAIRTYKHILIQVRDEAHRFAIGYHRYVRSKR